MKKINILIISLYYPPIVSIASDRIASFVRYLDSSLFDIHVMTLNNAESSIGADADTLRRNVTVHRLPSRGVFRKASFPSRQNPIIHLMKAGYNRVISMALLDEYRGWRKEVLRTAEGLVANGSIDIILSSYSPVASHLAALSLKRRHPRVKWIADMRDEMTRNPFLPHLTRWRLAGAEREILAAADAVTSVSRPILDHFQSVIPQNSILFREIRNGYDFDMPAVDQPKNAVFQIAYTGSFYGNYTPHSFFQAFDLFHRENPTAAAKVRIVGPRRLPAIPASIKHLVSFEAPVPHVQALAIMRQSDLLLLYHPRNGRKGYFSGKLFEYMASLRPILAMVDPDDVAADLIRLSRTGYVANSDHIDEIKNALSLAYDDWRSGLALQPDRDVIRQHHRSVQAGKLQELILQLCEPDTESAAPKGNS